jgi:hypothetical protein
MLNPFTRKPSARLLRQRVDHRKELCMSENRLALITGANKGIGLQIAKDLAAQNLTVLIGSLKYESGETAA